MKLETQKIIGKEILFFVSSIVLTFLVWLSLTFYNVYQKTHWNNLVVEINQNEILGDSLNISVVEFHKKIEFHKNRVFQQFGRIKGGIFEDGLPLYPIKHTKSNEPLGECDPIFQKWNGYELQLEKIYRYYKKNDPPRILNNKLVPVEDLIEKDNDFITKIQFYDSLNQSSSFREKIYTELTNEYPHTNCPTLSSFEEMLVFQFQKM